MLRGWSFVIPGTGSWKKRPIKSSPNSSNFSIARRPRSAPSFWATSGQLCSARVVESGNYNRTKPMPQSTPLPGRATAINSRYTPPEPVCGFLFPRRVEPDQPALTITEGRGEDDGGRSEWCEALDAGASPYERSRSSSSSAEPLHLDRVGRKTSYFWTRPAAQL